MERGAEFFALREGTGRSCGRRSLPPTAAKQCAQDAGDDKNQHTGDHQVANRGNFGERTGIAIAFASGEKGFDSLKAGAGIHEVVERPSRYAESEKLQGREGSFDGRRISERPNIPFNRTRSATFVEPCTLTKLPPGCLSNSS